MEAENHKILLGFLIAIQTALKKGAMEKEHLGHNSTDEYSNSLMELTGVLCFPSEKADRRTGALPIEHCIASEKTR